MCSQAWQTMGSGTQNLCFWPLKKSLEEDCSEKCVLVDLLLPTPIPTNQPPEGEQKKPGGEARVGSSVHLLGVHSHCQPLQGLRGRTLQRYR